MISARKTYEIDKKLFAAMGIKAYHLSEKGIRTFHQKLRRIPDGSPVVVPDADWYNRYWLQSQGFRVIESHFLPNDTGMQEDLALRLIEKMGLN